MVINYTLIKQAEMLSMIHNSELGYGTVVLGKDHFFKIWLLTRQFECCILLPEIRVQMGEAGTKRMRACNFDSYFLFCCSFTLRSNLQSPHQLVKPASSQTQWRWQTRRDFMQNNITMAGVASRSSWWLHAKWWTWGSRLQMKKNMGLQH